MEEEFKSFEESVNKDFKKLKNILELKRKDILNEGRKIRDRKSLPDGVRRCGIGTLAGIGSVSDTISELRLLPMVVYGKGTVVKVRVTSGLSSDGEFSCSVFDPDGQRAQDLKAISKMIEHDLETYPTAPLSQPVVGALCCARYGNDQKWYRARIESVVNVAKVKVVLLDYAAVDLVSVNEIFPLKEKYQCLPFQVMLCRLSEDTTLQFSREAKWKFGDLCRSKVLTAKIIGEVHNSSQHYIAELFYDAVNVSRVILEMMVKSSQSTKEVHPIIHRDIRLKDTLTPEIKEADSLHPVSEEERVRLPMRGVTVLLKNKASTEDGGTSNKDKSEPRPKYVEQGPQLKPIVQESDPIVQESGPVVQESGPVVQEPGPVVQESDPIVLESQPIVQEQQESEPIVQESEPIVQESEPIVQESEPIVQESEPIVQESEPVVQESEPVVQESEPVMQESDPIIQESKPIVQELESTLQVSEPVDQELEHVHNSSERISPPGVSASTAVKDDGNDLAVLPVPCHPEFKQGNRVQLIIMSPLDESGTFWAQLVVDSFSNDKFRTMTESLQISVQKYFGGDATLWSCGDYCSARFSEDRIWYRARVEAVDSDKVAVRYIDFGNAEELPGSYVVPLDREFRGLPYHSIKCSLASDQVFTEKMCEKFEEVTCNSEDNPILAKIESVSSDQVQVCLLLEAPGRDPINLNNEILLTGAEVKSMEFSKPPVKAVQSWADRMDELGSPTSILSDLSFPGTELSPKVSSVESTQPLKNPPFEKQRITSSKTFSNTSGLATKRRSGHTGSDRPMSNSIGIARILKTSLRKSVEFDAQRRRDHIATSHTPSHTSSPTPSPVLSHTPSHTSSHTPSHTPSHPSSMDKSATTFSENWEEEVSNQTTNGSTVQDIVKRPSPFVELYISGLPEAAKDHLRTYLLKYCSVKQIRWRNSQSCWLDVDSARAELTMKKVKDDILRDTGVSIVIEYAIQSAKWARQQHPSGHPSGHSSGHSSGHPSGHSSGHPSGHSSGHPSGHPL